MSEEFAKLDSKEEPAKRSKFVEASKTLKDIVGDGLSTLPAKR
jgi:hypothetical protein